MSPPQTPPTHVVLQALLRPSRGRALELCLAPLVVKEATVFINSNRAYINGNIQYIIRTYIQYMNI